MSSHREEFEDEPLLDRIRNNPQPAMRWSAVAVVLLAIEFGALASTVMGLPWNVPVGAVAGILPDAIASVLRTILSVPAVVGDVLASVPTLLTRELIPNRAHQVPGGGWEGAFLGLAPAYAWAIRVTLIYAYAFVWLIWLWRGYLTFRRHYRYAEWTPTDDIINRLRGHRWGQFGMVVVFLFIVIAVFAPALGPTTLEDNITNPYGHTVEYLDEETGEVAETTAGAANLRSASQGNSQNFGVGSYDPFDRFHPIGTLTTGKDLFTFLMYGARISMIIAGLSIVIGAGGGFALALLTAYYKGLVDLATILASDSVQAMPQLLLVIMLSVVLSDTWVGQIYHGGLLLALIWGFSGIPGYWRIIRGPAFQVVENEWVDAARSYGQNPRSLLRKHVAPYLVGYILIYASMAVGGVLIGTAGLSYLGIGITAPTPEWGRAVSLGQNYVTSASWHISIIPGLAVSLLALGFNALGDGIRDAIDPQDNAENTENTEAAAAGGGA